MRRLIAAGLATAQARGSARLWIEPLGSKKMSWRKIGRPTTFHMANFAERQQLVGDPGTQLEEGALLGLYLPPLTG